jgi:8-oxo-dGTP diphosphatase
MPPSANMPARPRLGVAVLVTDEHGRLLLGRRGQEPNYGTWVIPGGGVEGGESWCAAARRELLEETGLLVHVDRAQRPFVLEILTAEEHRLILCVRGSVEGGMLKASSDLIDAQFFSADELPPDLSPAVRPALAEFGWLDQPDVRGGARESGRTFDSHQEKMS